MCHSIDLSGDAACDHSSPSAAGDEVPLPFGVDRTGLTVVPCLDVPIKMPLVPGGCGGTMDCVDCDRPGQVPNEALETLVAFRGYFSLS